MQRPAVHQAPLPHDHSNDHQSDGCGDGPWIWLVAGTGEGPPLAARLLGRGWRVRVSVVSQAASRAYAPHPRLEMAVGAICADAGGAGDPVAAVLAELRAAAQRGQACRWVIDASHPFARRISAGLATACRLQGQPLLRLRRPQPEAPGAGILPDLPALEAERLADRRLLLAIGARRLAEAMGHCPGAIHHARLLPSPEALRQAMAAGIAAERVACLRPPGEADAAAAIEAALCRRWGIEVVLCRRSGGPSETHWRRICEDLGLRLLLLERPPEEPGVMALTLESLLARVGHPPNPCHGRDPAGAGAHQRS